ncbi:MAG: leucine-rich repeat protein [Bacteroidales bacterium]|nr:leucine-rich repeat protein [Bacteroidales bacterium]
MKKKAGNKILYALSAVFTICLCLAFFACGGDESTAPDAYGDGEEGFYYYDGSDSVRYMLSLQSGTYMMTANGDVAYSGKYSYDRDGGVVTFSSGGGDFSASLGEKALSLDVSGTGYSFKAYRYFDVTYVDETGKTLATESVLNGQCARDMSLEKDGYYFIGWYEDADNSSVFSFDASIAGDTTVYGWYIEKNPAAAEYVVTLDYGDGVRETLSTQNGAVWGALPAEHGGADILGWWVSAINKSDELTYRYSEGGAFSSDTVLFAVYGGLGASVTSDGVTWDASSASANVTVSVYGEDGARVAYGTVSSSSGFFASSEFYSLSTGRYEVEVTSGGVTETLAYVVNGLDRVSASSACVIVNGGGRVLSFSPVDGAEYYEITVTNGERDATENLGSRTYYNFSDWEMTKEGVTFTVRAHADGFVDSVSDSVNCLFALSPVSVEIVGRDAVWNRVEGATEYEVTVESGGTVLDFFTTTETSFSLKYYGVGIYDITVRPVTDGYWSEAYTYHQYAKTSLAAPRITDVTGYSVSWGKVDGAASYVVRIGDETYVVESGETLFFSEIPSGLGTYEISVMACGENGDDSPYGDPVIATENAFGAAVTYYANTVSWNYDVAATAYGVSMNGGEETFAEKGNALEIELTKSGYNEITVTAYKGTEPLGQAVLEVYAYTVILDGNGLETEKDALYVAQGDKLRLGGVSGTILEHADFVGWYTLPDFTSGQSDEYGGKGAEVRDGATFTGCRDTYLYAYWTYRYFDVALDAGGGTFSEESVVSVKYGSESLSLPVPVAADATLCFIGWYTTPDGDGTRYTSESGEWIKGSGYAGEETLYARYLTVLKFSQTRYGGEQVCSVSAGKDIDEVAEVTVPETYDGKKLILGSSAFAGCRNLEIINIPDTVLYISVVNDGYRAGTGAFSTCPALKEVNVYVTGDEPSPSKEVVYFSYDGVLFQKIGDDAYAGAEILYFPYAREEERYEIPSSVSNTNECDAFGAAAEHAVTTIPYRVFRDRKIREIVIPASVTTVEEQAFYDNAYIEKVYFSGGGTEPLSVGAYAFAYCTALEEVTFPARFSDLYVGTFEGCTSFVNVYVEDGGVFSSDGGVLLSASGSALVFLPTGRGGEIDVGSLTSTIITAIGDYAVAYNESVTSVAVPGSVTELGRSAFEGCTNLSSVSFSGSDNSGDLTIKSRAFYGCTRLGNVSLPANLTCLEADAFGGCTGLTYVYFDSRSGTVSSDLDFAEGAFGAYNYITALEFGENVPVIDIASVFDGGYLSEVIIPANDNYLLDGYGAVYDAQGSTILYYPRATAGDYVLLDTATTVRANIFAGRVDLTSVTIGKNVNTIEDGAFYGCTFLENIFVDKENSCYGNSLGADGKADGILYGKEDGCLSEIIFCPPASKVTKIETAKSIVKVADRAFYGDSVIESVAFASDAESFELGEYAFCGCTALTEVILPESTEVVSVSAFYDCVSLSSIGIPSRVKVIEESAFEGCASLTGDLTAGENGTSLPEGLKIIGDRAFCGDVKLAVTIPSTVEKIGEEAFFQCWNDSSAKAEIIFAKASEGDGDAPLEIGEKAFYGARYATAVVIPARTTDIGSDAFYNFAYLVSDPVPTIGFEEGCGVTEIGCEVFAQARYVKEITVPGTITEIGERAFYNCTSLEIVNFAPEGAESGLETIGVSAFSGTTSLDNLVIPAGVKIIDNTAFYNSLLTEITFESGSGLESIGDSAFRGISATEIRVPASVTSVGFCSFGDNTHLAYVSFQGEGETSGVKELGRGLFSGCTNLASVDLPAALEVTGTGSTPTFSKCTSLESITIPASVKTIWESTFDGCTALKTVTFATDENGLSSLEEVQDGAFAGCASLEEFSFPQSSSSVKLGSRVFDGCVSLASVYLSASVTDIGGGLAGSGITRITVDEANGSYMTGAEEEILYSRDGKTIAYVCEKISAASFTVPDGIETIGPSAFSGQTAIRSVTLGRDVTAIGAYAFYGCTALESVVFTNGSVGVEMGEYAFSGCTKLADINLPEGTEEIPEGCFEKSDLSETTLPSSLKAIGDYAFRYTSVAEIDLQNIESVGRFAFGYMYSLKSVKLGENLKELGSYAFYGCSALETTEWECGVTEVADFTFYGCTSLKFVEIPAYVTSVGFYAFYGCASLEEVVIPSSVTDIYSCAFSGCANLRSCELPKSLTSLYDSAFEGCKALESVMFPESLVEIGDYAYLNSGITSVEMDANLQYIGDYAFRGCEGLETVIVGRKVWYLGTGAFYGCSSLTYAYVGDSITELATNMFYGCASLKVAEFGFGLVSIGDSAFRGCTSLENVDLGRTAASIGKYAFYGCTSLESIVIPATVTYIGDMAFYGCSCDVFVQNSKNYADTYLSGSWAGDCAVYYYTETEPAGEGNFWHYGDDGKAAVWRS